MPTEEQLKTALINADKAGDTVAAKKLANALKRMRVEPVESPKTNDSYALNTAREGLQGMTFGFSDELGAGMAALAASMTSDATFNDAYKDIVGSIRQEQNAFREENPKTAFAAQMAGGLASGVGGLAKLGAKEGAKVGARVLQNAAVGAGEGALAGAGFSDENKLKGAAQGAAIGSLAGAIGGEVVNKFQKNSALKREASELFETDPQNAKLAAYMKTGQGKIVGDKAAQEAMRQGYDEGIVQAVKGASNRDRIAMSRMVSILEKGKNNRRYGAINRPVDVAGDSLAKRVKFIQQANKKAGMAVDRAARGLKGQEVDYRPAVNSFLENLDDFGVKFDPVTNSISFKGSDFEKIPGAERAIKNLLSRMRDTNAPDAYDVHRLKRFIDNNVEYGKNSGGSVGQAEILMKKLRTDLNTALKGKFSEYDQANAAYRETKTAIDGFQKAAGKAVDFDAPNLDKALGTSSRRFLGNAQSRPGLINSLNDIETIAAKNGAKFDDDVITQALFADELDSMFGAAAKTSLQGDVQKATKHGVNAALGNVREAATDLLASKVDDARGINEENAIKAIKELLKRQSTSSKTRVSSSEVIARP